MSNSQKQPGINETQDKAESAEITRSREFVAEAMTNALSEVSQGMFVDVSPINRKGNLKERDVSDFLSIIGEIGLENFTAEATEWGYAQTETVNFLYKDQRGGEYEIQSYCPKYGGLGSAGDNVLREIHVYYRPKPGFAPIKTLTVSNSETSCHDLRTMSVIRYSSNLYKEATDARPPIEDRGAFLEREITLVNPRYALYSTMEYID